MNWKVHTLPRVTVPLMPNLTLSIATDDQEIVELVERAAHAAGMILTRLEPDAVQA